MKDHKPKPGRNAWICMAKGHEGHARRFLKPGEPKPTCEQHGNSMVPQENKAYRGMLIP